MGMFDSLIPKPEGAAAPGGGMFDSLVPKKSGEVVPDSDGNTLPMASHAPGTAYYDSMRRDQQVQGGAKSPSFTSVGGWAQGALLGADSVSGALHNAGRYVSDSIEAGQEQYRQGMDLMRQAQKESASQPWWQLDPVSAGKGALGFLEAGTAIPGGFVHVAANPVGAAISAAIKEGVPVREIANRTGLSVEKTQAAVDTIAKIASETGQGLVEVAASMPFDAMGNAIATGLSRAEMAAGSAVTRAGIRSDMKKGMTVDEVAKKRGMKPEQVKGALKEADTGSIAGKRVSELAAQDAESGRTQATVDKDLDEMRALGKPVGLADVGGGNVRGGAKHVFRSPGESMGLADEVLTRRDEGAATRLLRDSHEFLGTGSTFETKNQLFRERTAKSRPLYARLQEVSQSVPLEHQFMRAMETASTEHQTAIAEIKRVTDEMSNIEEKIASTHGTISREELANRKNELENLKLDAEESMHRAAEDMTIASKYAKKAKEDKDAGLRGGVFHPHIMRMLEAPAGAPLLRRGQDIEANMASGQNRPARQTDAAIVGKDAQGNPVVEQVPTVSHLLVFKEGLDASLEHAPNINETTGRITKSGLAIKEMSNGLVKRMDELLPGYREARDAWAGPSASINAVDWGKKGIFVNSPEENAVIIAGMSESEKEFARIGLAEKFREDILKANLKADEAKRIFKSEWVNLQIKGLFKTEKHYDDFLKAVTAERLMYDTRTMRSDTAQNLARKAEEEGTLLPIQAGIHLAMGNKWAAAHSWMKWLKGQKGQSSKDVNSAIARIMLDPTMRLGVAEPTAERAVIQGEAPRRELSRSVNELGPINQANRQGLRQPGQQLRPADSTLSTLNIGPTSAGELVNTLGGPQQ